jgi:capsular polysaccharide biosynthesis protein
MAARRKKNLAGVRTVADDVGSSTATKPLGSSAHSLLQMYELTQARITAQPVSVHSHDWQYQWFLSPQLQRTPKTATVIPQSPHNELKVDGTWLFAAVDGFSYYHWIVGVLPRIIAAKRIPEIWNACQAIYVTPKQKGSVPFQKDSLRMLGCDGKKMIYADRGHHFSISRLIVAEDPCPEHQTNIHPASVQLLREHFIGKNETPKGSKRIFISRAQARRRHLTNEDDLYSKLKTRGFERVSLDQMPFADQVQLFNQASCVVGIHGAGLSNIVFAPSNCVLIELTAKQWSNPCFQNLAKRCGQSPHQIIITAQKSKRPFMADAEADVNGVVAQIDRILKT